MGTQPEHMVVGFRGCTVVRAVKRTGEQLQPGGCRTRFLTVISTYYGPVPFMEKFCIVTAGALRASGKVKIFRGKINGGVLSLTRI